MKKRILTLLLALVLIVGTCTTALATDSSASDNQVNVEWVYDENGQCTWEVRSGIIEGTNFYQFEIWKDGTVLGVESPVLVEAGENHVDSDISGYISESGDYQVKVYQLYENEYGGYNVGEYCGISDTATFTRPEKTLNTTVGTIGADKIFRFNTVDGAKCYWIEIHGINLESGEVGLKACLSTTPENSQSNSVEVDISKYIEDFAYEEGEGIYAAAIVKAISNNVNECASSEYGSYSEPYYIKFTTDDVKESLNEITTLEQGLTYLDSVTTETLQTAMTTDTEVVGKIAEIEKMYAEENEIKVSSTVAKNAQSLVDNSKISMVGSALNAKTEKSTVELKVSVPEKNVNVADTYTNAVQLDISLLVNDTAISELEIPITITMPIPTGVNAKNLVILHYHDNATTPNVITPTVNADGTISFTVSGFSTFVFANTVASNTTTNGSANTDNTTTTIEKAPATGDTTNVYFLVLTMMLALGSIVVCMKRRTFAKNN